MSRSVLTGPRWFTGSLVALSLTGCPLSDRYYVEKNKNMGSGGSAGSATQTTVETGGSGGANGSAVGGESGGGTAAACDVSTCEGACCDGVCTDTSSDRNHCGACDNACPSGRKCRSGSCYGWTTMAKPPESFVARERSAYTVVGNKIFIFGGLNAAGKALNDAALYDPLTDSWSLIPKTLNAPSARQLASAVWTGKTVYLIGGTDANKTTAFANGGQFDPVKMTWTPLPNLLVGRVAPYLASFTTSDYVLVWGGLNVSGAPISGGGSCVNACQSWSAISTGVLSGGPPPLTDPTWIVVANTSVLFFGGKPSTPQASIDAFQFVPNTSQWGTVAGPGPIARWGAFGVSDSIASYVWGGRNDTAAFNNGSRYVSNGGWSTLEETNAPSPRWAPLRRSGWMLALETGDVVVLGGMNFNGTLLTDGGRFTPSKSEWSLIESWPSSGEHEYGVAVSIGEEAFVWGGRSTNGPTTTGERYLP